MYKLSRVPLLKLFVAYASGILLARFFILFISFKLLLTLFVISILVLGFSFFLYRSNRVVFSLTSSFVLLLLGALSFISNDERNSTDHFSKHINQTAFSKNTFVAKVKDLTKTGSGNTKIITNVQHLIKDSDTIDVTGTLLLNTNIKYNISSLKAGDIILFKANISSIKPAQNPLAFNAKQYYFYQNIHKKAFLKSAGFTILQREKNVNTYFKSLNHSIQKIIRQNMPNPVNANLVISIMLGDKQYLTKDLLTTFATTGIRHILTVSGMHVGIVALIINFVFSFMKRKNKYLNIVKIIALIASIWFYVFLTGAGAATLRSAFMISLLMIGINIRKTINTFNLLFGSAFVLLLINPYLLFQLGFILSYTAILSILIFYKPIYRLLPLRKYRLLDYFWQMISLSIAAQILIFPLSIYYFHNAPSLFILTAVIATPMAFAAIAIGFSIVLMSSLLPDLVFLFAKLLNVILNISMKFINYIESISFNIGDKIYLETIDILLLYTSIAILYLLIIQKKYKYGIYAIITIFLFISNQFLRSNHNQDIVIYSIDQNHLMDIFINDKCYTIGDKNIDKNTLNYSTKNIRLYKKTKVIKINDRINNAFINSNSNIIEVLGKTIVLLEDKKDLLPLKHNQIDLLVLNKEINFDLDALLTNYSLKNIVILKGMKYKLRKSWITKAKKAGINLWDIRTQGAYYNNLKTI